MVGSLRPNLPLHSHLATLLIVPVSTFLVAVQNPLEQTSQMFFFLTLTLPFIPIITGWAFGQLTLKRSRQLYGRIFGWTSLSFFIFWIFFILGLLVYWRTISSIPPFDIGPVVLLLVTYGVITVLMFLLVSRIEKTWTIVYPPYRHGFPNIQNWDDLSHTWLSFILGLISTFSLTIGILIII